MEGEFDRTRQGLFLHHQFGGKLYRWGEIDSLPAPMHNTIRTNVLDWLDSARQHHEQAHTKHVDALLNDVYNARMFLTREDWARPELRNADLPVDDDHASGSRLMRLRQWRELLDFTSPYEFHAAILPGSMIAAAHRVIGLTAAGALFNTYGIRQFGLIK